MDVAIYVNENSIPTKEVFYEIELSNQLEEIIKISIDVVMLNRASDTVLYKASKGILINNSDDNIRTNFITTHWKIYWDFKNQKFGNSILDFQLSL